MSKKDPFAPISLTGKQAEWFVGYLEGKVKPDKNISKRRSEILKEASELKGDKIACL